MKIAMKELRGFIASAMKEMADRDRVFDLVSQINMELARENGLNAKQLNSGGWGQMLKLAFAEINPPEFGTREELTAAHSYFMDQYEKRFLEDSRAIKALIREVLSDNTVSEEAVA